MRTKIVIVLATALMLAACCPCRGAEHGRIITPAETVERVAWTAEECAKPIAVRPLRATAEVSVSLIRMSGAEKPHTHDQHDLTVVLLCGAGVLHIGERTVALAPGDVMEIPRGVVHWAENRDPEASVVYAIFSPPYDGQDSHPMDGGK